MQHQLSALTACRAKKNIVLLLDPVYIFQYSEPEWGKVGFCG